MCEAELLPGWQVWSDSPDTAVGVGWTAACYGQCEKKDVGRTQTANSDGLGLGTIYTEGFKDGSFSLSLARLFVRCWQHLDPSPPSLSTPELRTERTQGHASAPPLNSIPIPDLVSFWNAGGVLTSAPLEGGEIAAASPSKFSPGPYSGLVGHYSSCQLHSSAEHCLCPGF